ncbi:hypothetical protein NP284_24495 [Rhodopseudomonas pseudopalustris]|uniref:Peroxiredoxin (Alkyl hydroperoxide reductase subunit C) n=1 Tax=Rhodopseudomonas pseudopalustris TaxID=1513892 RepID=A0A1H8VJB7_9BRAD|nr:hypothetical protein [Rhodopseudomonas pseudopalustris]SEP15390.1 peroxiredoxin (alkyl hydroperoxide reductase subunit C) [Rhodopseudomonas pseudopalustris]
MVGPPKTVAEVATRMSEGLETTDWYFSKRTL